MESALAPTYLEHPEVLCFISVSSQLFSSGNDRSAENAVNNSHSVAPQEGKPRALVVDDVPDVTEMIALFLQHAGYETVMAFSAPDALEMARSEKFDVVVSDIGMPGMNGYELAEALRGIPDYSTVPMIAVTGFSAFDDRKRALQSGFNEHMTKPINPASLLELIQRLRD
ncbi:MAG: response regulator [Acidobacteria bacterium]|nr:response regulator [Acidobacteriota bacterium]